MWLATICRMWHPSILELLVGHRVGPHSRSPGLPATENASRFSWDDEVLRPRMPRGCARFPNLADGQYHFLALGHFDVCKAAVRTDAMDSSAENARGVAKKLHVNWGHTSAHQLKRTLVHAERANNRLSDSADNEAGRL